MCRKFISLSIRQYGRKRSHIRCTRQKVLYHNRCSSEFVIGSHYLRVSFLIEGSNNQVPRSSDIIPFDGSTVALRLNFPDRDKRVALRFSHLHIIKIERNSRRRLLREKHYYLLVRQGLCRQIQRERVEEEVILLQSHVIRSKCIQTNRSQILIVSETSVLIHKTDLQDTIISSRSAISGSTDISRSYLELKRTILRCLDSREDHVSSVIGVGAIHIECSGTGMREETIGVIGDTIRIV